MADYFTSFSLILSLPDEAAQQYALQLAQLMSEAGPDTALPDTLPLSIREQIDDWTFETEPAAEPIGLWLHSDFGGIDAVCAFIQHLLIRCSPETRVTFEWACSCSKPRIDAYGGGAAIITASNIQTLSTAEWIEQH